ncbi:hypothetical protein BV25DRAFT_1855527 [Artomyces pyxidatus]|uniref:Uncharacterized protein n=1 Tax=Artomyces pyxidatus TaxID=48021 RepID=A0ACB8T3K9_9AGAM|nr:hypothetical protein BV25DRAFT_1855527 [Artomyces pyxidatus]
MVSSRHTMIRASMLLPFLFVHAFLVRIGSGWPLADPTLSIPSNGTALLSIADTSATCTDIAICRTRYTIIWSSLVTILACVWSAVHRNIPEPAKPADSRVRRIVDRVLEIGKIVIVTLLVPEWVLAWAVRQLLNARDLARQLESLRDGMEAKKAWSDKRKKLRGMKLGWTEEEVARSDRSAATVSSERVALQAENELGLEEKEEGGSLAFQESALAIDEQTGRFSTQWRTRHGFFIVMGGFHYYINGEPKHPLSRQDVVKLVEAGELVPPTEDEIRGWSQGDALSKTLAVVQTLWFVVQCIARRAEDLPITQLEIMTLAYTTITVAMYLAWWDKPQNVGGAVRVAVKTLPKPEPANELGWYWRFVNIIAGMQDTAISLRDQPCVPTFYSGGTADENNDLFSDIVALAVAMVFGAVHCAAWHYVFPSHTEKVMWHISSVAIVAVPGAMLFVLLLFWVMMDSYYRGEIEAVIMSVFFLSVPVYVAGRLLLLALAFSTLRSLPSRAYEAVQWTLLIPHFT